VNPSLYAAPRRPARAVRARGHLELGGQSVGGCRAACARGTSSLTLDRPRRAGLRPGQPPPVWPSRGIEVDEARVDDQSLAVDQLGVVRDRDLLGLADRLDQAIADDDGPLLDRRAGPATIFAHLDRVGRGRIAMGQVGRAQRGRRDGQHRGAGHDQPTGRTSIPTAFLMLVAPRWDRRRERVASESLRPGGATRGESRLGNGLVRGMAPSLFRKDSSSPSYHSGPLPARRNKANSKRLRVTGSAAKFLSWEHDWGEGWTPGEARAWRRRGGALARFRT